MTDYVRVQGIIEQNFRGTYLPTASATATYNSGDLLSTAALPTNISIAWAIHSLTSQAYLDDVTNTRLPFGAPLARTAKTTVQNASILTSPKGTASVYYRPGGKWVGGGNILLAPATYAISTILDVVPVGASYTTVKTFATVNAIPSMIDPSGQNSYFENSVTGFFYNTTLTGGTWTEANFRTDWHTVGAGACSATLPGGALAYNTPTSNLTNAPLAWVPSLWVA